ncbi:hypothetical protein [Spongiimicrobium sp. 2-473A-2-J]|uniref:hypothetical protein n=1 Tax=Eudoraea algarum TaxID=3417568 RepID=UPI003D360C2D
MRKVVLIIYSALFTLSCTDNFSSVVDFTQVENPNLSEASVVGQPNSSIIWLAGLERELAFCYNEILILAELGSDNYMNTQTFFSQFLDQLELQNTDPDLRDFTREIQRLREMALFGLESVGPADPEYTTTTEAEFQYFLGLAHMYAAMYFPALPQEPIGPAIPAAQHYEHALSAFASAITLNPLPEYYLATARVNYYTGNKTAAVSAARQALALNAKLDRFVRFDEAAPGGVPPGTNPSNVMESALFERATFDDFQPLPTLDFLDPKYSFLTAEEDAPVHYLKAEEALLILAEANLSDNKIDAARVNLTELLALVATRETRNIDDSTEGRIQVAPGSRPNKASVVVNGRRGLVLDRQAGNVDVPSVSGTSLTAADIAGLKADDAGLELLYRTRQEVFIAEGLRFVDMGLKLIIDENEVLQNENINKGDLGTVPLIPAFISSVVKSLDAITYDPTKGVATTVINVNQILVANKSTPEVLPFH